jgi:hypothetical protein
VFFLLGPLVLLVSQYVRDRQLAPALGRFFAACGATVALSALYAVVHFHGTEIFSEWISKMALHETSHTNWTVGFETILNTKMESVYPIGFNMTSGAGHDAEFVQYPTLLLWIIRVLVVLPALWFVRSMAPASAYAFAYVVMFFSVAPVGYYSMVLCLPLLYFIAQPASWSRTLGIVWLLLTGALGYLLYYGWQPLHTFWLFAGYGQSFATTFYMAWFITLTALHMVAHAAGVAMAQQRAAANASAGPKCRPSGGSALRPCLPTRWWSCRTRTGART